MDRMNNGEVTYKKVDEWLNNVDYTDDPNYVPSRFALHFIAFIKLINGAKGEENKTPVLHMKMLDAIGNVKPNKRFPRIANMVHRGAGKTTVFGEYLFFYLAVYLAIPNFGEITTALFLSDSMENGVKKMRKNLEYRYENSPFLKKYIPKLHFTDSRWEFTNINGESLVVTPYGAKTGVRGTKEQGTRPRLAVMDDLVSDEDARSKTILESIKRTVNNAISYALHPEKHMIIWSGTPFNESDPLYEAIESGAWEVNVYPVCEKFPVSRKEFKGSWPDRFDYDYVNDAYEKARLGGALPAFYQELMLRIMSDDQRLLLDSDFKWYDLNSLLSNKSNFNFYITTDFATSEKQSADFSSISVWAVNNKGYFYWVDGILVRQTMDKNINDLFRLAKLYNPLLVGIEVSGQQGGFIPWINKEMMERNVFFQFASENNKGDAGIRPSTNKLQRFNVVLPWFKLGKMFFPAQKKESPVLKEGINQLSLIAAGAIQSKNDDFIDTTSQLGCIAIHYPSADQPDRSVNGLWHVGEDSLDCGISSYIV